MRHSICTDHLLWAVRSAISQQTAGLLVDILICAVAPDFGSASLHGLFRVGVVMGRLGFRVGVSASYSYFRVSRKITTFIIREKFSRKIASIVNYIS